MKFFMILINMIAINRLSKTHIQLYNKYKRINLFLTYKTFLCDYTIIDTVEDGEKIKYSFEYIIDDEQSRETQNNYINNMADYKKNLPTWPVTHTIL